MEQRGSPGAAGMEWITASHPLSSAFTALVSLEMTNQQKKK